MLSAAAHLLVQAAAWYSGHAQSALLIGRGTPALLLWMAAAQLVHVATVGLCAAQDALWYN